MIRRRERKKERTKEQKQTIWKKGEGEEDR